MLLQFLIPHYHETYEQIRPLLTSIALQQGINFDEIGAIICNDGDDILLDEDNLKKYPYEIKYKICEHKGVSATRQSCFDMATADYVMFCDADDMFTDMLALCKLFNKIEETEFDMLISTFVEEYKRNDEYVNSGFLEIADDKCFVHGKLFYRQYIIDKGIKWDENFKVQEDSYFVYLCYGCLEENDRFEYMSEPFYLWKYRNESLSRDKKYMLKTYPDLIDVYDATIKEFIRRGNEYQAQYYCTTLTYDVYYTMNKPEWKDEENKGYRDATEKRFSQFYKEFKSLFESADETMKKNLNKDLRSIMIYEGMELEYITFNDWIKEIETLS